MELNSLTAIGPIDGRYRSKTESLSPYFSEFGLIKYRVQVEIEYFIALCRCSLPQLPSLTAEQEVELRKVYKNFSEDDAQTIKDTEKVTNHDVKAVEYFVKEALSQLDLSDYEEFIHFGLTSQDINNTAVPLSLKAGFKEAILPEIESVFNQLVAFSEEWKNVPMLARTHGQPASPTRMGKEFDVFVYRLHEQLNQLKQIKTYGKFGGATGNFNAHVVAYPRVDWVSFANDFLGSMGLTRQQRTTQIENYDHMAALFDGIRRINVILIDLARDIWTYISMDYFKQKVVANEVGSSAMPHKVNPIDFENAEGNLGIANSILDHLSNKLPISRLQRDLTDSTVLRNLGIPLGHTLIALKSLQKGLDKLVLNEEAINSDLDKQWAVVAEAIQTILRREGYPKPYEALKALTRGAAVIDQESIHTFIDTLEVSDTIKAELREITPFNYTGL
jgi:adenylosuccinate lyase